MIFEIHLLESHKQHKKLMVTTKQKEKNITKSFRKRFPKFKEISEMPTSCLTMSVDEVEKRQSAFKIPTKTLLLIPILFFIGLIISLMI